MMPVGHASLRPVSAGQSAERFSAIVQALARGTNPAYRLTPPKDTFQPVAAAQIEFAQAKAEAEGDIAGSFVSPYARYALIKKEMPPEIRNRIMYYAGLRETINVDVGEEMQNLMLWQQGNQHAGMSQRMVEQSSARFTFSMNLLR
jgi:hypothetical protein